MAKGIVLQKAIAEAGVASRRAAEELIAARQVKVNGSVVRKLGTRVDPKTDKIEINGRRLGAGQLVYFLLHKPKGVVSTASDEKNRRTVVDLVQTRARLVPVGRLDINTTGLLLLTNDGELVHKLTHPRFEHEKEYHALAQMPHSWTEKEVKAALAKMASGVRIAGNFRTSPAKTKLLAQKSNDRFWVSVIIREGRKHQVRQMLNAVGLTVVELMRVRMGSLALGELGIGQARELTPEEIEKLKQETE